MSLVNELIKGLLPEEEKKQTTAVYAGGFKPPTSGHFEVVKEALEENPEIDEFIIFVGSKERNGITQAESVLIWEIYNDYLPLKVKIVPTSKPPIQAVYNFSKDHPTREVLWVIGAREGNEEDFKDITSRTKSISNYPNLELRTIITAGGVSGTAARNAAQVSFEKFKKFAPDVLSDDEKYEVYELVSGKVNEGRKKKKDPKKGTGKKPKGSGRRLYTDEDPNDTVRVKFSTRQDIVNTLNKKSFKAKSHARQSQVINLIHQRTRAAYNRTKDPVKKKRLKTALEYITKRKEASKKKTQRLKKQKNENVAINHKGKAAPFGSGYKKVKEGDTIEKYSAKGKATGKLKQGTVRKRLNIPKGKKIPLSLINKELARLRKMDKDPDKKGAQLGDKNQKYYKALQLAKTLKTTTNVNESFSQMNKIDQIKAELKYFTENNLVLDFSTKDPFKDKVVVYPDFQGVDIDEDIIGTEKVLNVTDCIGNEPYKDYKYFTTTKKEYVEKMIKNASGDGWKSFDPIVVVPHPILNGKYSVVDGNHRLGAFVIGNLPKINAKILSEDQILLAAPGTKWKDNSIFSANSNNFPETIPFKDSKGKVDLKKYFATQPLKVPTNINEDFPLIVLHGDKIDTTFKFNQDLIESTAPTPILVNNINLHKTTKFNNDKIKSLKFSISNKESIPPIIVREHNNQYQVLDGHHRYISYKELDKKYIDAIVLTQNQVIEISSSKELDLIYEKIFSKYPDFRKFNYSPYIASLTQHMIDKGMKLEPLPQIQMVHDDIENGEDIFGKTAYYAPQTNIIVLFTYGRHPKDILRSYAHELVHVHQNMEDRLETINTTDVNQDDHLEQLEREAYETGNIMFRSWTDSITGNKLNEEIKIDESLPPINRLYRDLEKIKHNFFGTILTEGKKKNKDPFGLMAYAHELGRLREEESEYKVYLDMDGVLADFDKRFKDLSGMGPSEFESKYGKNKFWDFIDEEHKVSFWVGIEPMPGAADLVNAVKDYNYELLTSPSVKKQSYLGKILWVRNHTGDIFPSKPRINFRKAKEKHEIKPQLSKTDILIDDREDTIGRWNAAGGTGIVYKNISQVLNDLAKLGL